MKEMMREITQTGSSQSPDVLKWKTSLRNHDREAPSSSLRKSESFNNLRKSTGNLAMSFDSTGKSTARKIDNELEKIESEYIKNLQQQQMQSDVESMQMEVKRKDASAELAMSEKERLQNRLKAEEDAYAREKRLLLEEVVQLKKEKEALEKDGSRKDGQVLRAREELDQSAAALRSAETKIQMLRNQLVQREDQNKIIQSALDEKRNEVLKTETSLREMEEKYYTSSASLQDKIVPDLREEVRQLHRKLKEAEMNGEQDRYLRNKLSDDSGHLIKENALLNQQVVELQKQLERERELREANDGRRDKKISELVALREKEKTLQLELAQTQDSLKHEKTRAEHYLQQLSKRDQYATSQELQFSTTKCRLAEVEGQCRNFDAENSDLRRDKHLLTELLADVQNQVDEKDKEIMTLRAHIHSLESRLHDLEHLKDLETTVNSQKWEEFSRLAESMKTLSRSMAHSTSGEMNSTNKSPLLDYS
ncbi:hypothetical protein CAPTEDRAFT_188336 [Capitella teleta]|uniref:Uncharacterized protein n=1 Tax=Capitella teleta TaxID=283909 RepID=R7VI17_CAPTE|nr:hypothetical protein CAPTEDRAFT_188336 [Capitella teleta]|eukprot:ELU18498.1 hypothetical protein CAPTEDRAFT_188336 [Capitella teleta]